MKNYEEIHVWDFPNTVYFSFAPSAREEYFNKIYSFYSSKRKAALALGVHLKTIRNYECAFSIKFGVKHPQYIPVAFLKRTLSIFDLSVLSKLEQNIVAISVRNGLDVKNPKLPICESPYLYKVIAHVIADGSASQRSTPYYANSCKELRENFKTYLKIFGDAEISEQDFRTVIGVRFPKVITDIASKAFDVRFTYPDRLPKTIFTAPFECQSAFLQALFDDEGTISTNLAIGIHNLNIMNEIKQLINLLGIKTGPVMIHPYQHKMDKVTLRVPKSEYVKFKERIGFSHPEKVRKLDLAIQTMNRVQRTRDPSFIEQEILELLQLGSLRTLDLANTLQFTITGIIPHLNRMLANGQIIKQGYRNRFVWAFNTP